MLTTLGEIDAYNAKQRKRVVDLIAAHSDDGLMRRPAADRWNALEHAEHLALTDLLFLPVVQGLVEQGRREGLTSAPDTIRHLDPIPALAAAGALDRRFVAPDASQPKGRSRAEVLALLDEARGQMLTWVAELPRLDTDKLSYYHPNTGATFNLAQLWYFLGLHEYRHVGYIRELVAQP